MAKLWGRIRFWILSWIWSLKKIDPKPTLPRPKAGPARIPAPGFVWNPISDWPRNAPCVCGADKKFKSCHYGKVPLTCKEEDAVKLKKLVDAVRRGAKIKTSRAPEVGQ